jgi:hypothetical protein
LRTGPLVRRGANVSRTGQAAAPAPRMLPRVFSKQDISLAHFPLLPIKAKATTRSTCCLPINLRTFLAAQLGCRSAADDETILSFAAHADQFTLNKLARAIRRYSTARAHEAWAECSLPVAAFIKAYRDRQLAVLCLRCVRLDFGAAASGEHRHNGCVPITLVGGESSNGGPAAATEVPEKIQHVVEEFRALRTAFGLSHFDLDCYVRGEQLTLMWRPLP